MDRLRTLVGIGSIMLLGFAASAQVSVLDSVWVERFHQEVRDGDTLSTYRLYAHIDRAASLQMVYGTEHHPLLISTTRTFHNQVDGNWPFAHTVPKGGGYDPSGAFDSWVTLGAADEAHWGVPLAKDVKGSIYVEHPRCTGPRSKRPAVCTRDGLLPSDSIPEVVTFRFTPSFLGDVKGAELHTMDGAWAVLGGVSARHTDGQVLLAQITTTGSVLFEINLQIGLPDGSFIRYVHSAPGPGEVLDPSLRQRVSWNAGR